jgi:hypothetical protein
MHALLDSRGRPPARRTPRSVVQATWFPALLLAGMVACDDGAEERAAAERAAQERRTHDVEKCRSLVDAVAKGPLEGEQRKSAAKDYPVAVRIADGAISAEDLPLAKSDMPCSQVSPEAAATIWTKFVVAAAASDVAWGGSTMPSEDLLGATLAAPGLSDASKSALGTRAEDGARQCKATGSSPTDFVVCLQTCALAADYGVENGPACKAAAKERDRVEAAARAEKKRDVEAALRCTASECGGATDAAGEACYQACAARFGVSVADYQQAIIDNMKNFR